MSMLGLWGPALLTGCEPPATSELVSVVVTSTVDFDTFCDGGVCAGNEQASAVLAFEANVFVPETGRFEVLQYRVDYDVPGADIPFYAEQTWAMVLVASESPFSFRPAGDVQRDRARNAITEEELAGEATLTLVGYDHKNTVVEIDTIFDIVFRDVLPTETTGDDDDDDTVTE